MKRVAIVTLVLALSGCWLVEPQYVALDDQTVATLQAKWGTDLEGMRAEVETMLGAQVRGLQQIDGKLTAVLEPPLLEAAEAGAGSFISKAVKNPTVQDTVAGLVAAVLAGFGVIQTRKKLKKKPQKK